MATVSDIENWVVGGVGDVSFPDIAVPHLEVVRWIISKMPNASSKNHSISSAGRRTSSRAKKNALMPRLGLSTIDSSDDDSTVYINKRMATLIVFLIQYYSNDLGAHLWWVTPTILNFMDHISIPIKLLGVEMFSAFLNVIPRQVFENSGLFTVYYDVLKGLCYYFPPHVDYKVSLQIFKTVYPCLLNIISLMPNNEKYYLDFFSEVLLRTTIPRVHDLNPQLSVFVLNFFNTEYLVKKSDIYINAQRIIYIIGENFVRNPFLTVDIQLLEETQRTVDLLIDIEPKHKYDYLAMIIFMWEKCVTEGYLDHSILFEHMYSKIADRSPLTQDEKTKLVLSRKDIDLKKLIT